MELDAIIVNIVQHCQASLLASAIGLWSTVDSSGGPRKASGCDGFSTTVSPLQRVSEMIKSFFNIFKVRFATHGPFLRHSRVVLVLFLVGFPGRESNPGHRHGNPARNLLTTLTPCSKTFNLFDNNRSYPFFVAPAQIKGALSLDMTPKKCWTLSGVSSEIILNPFRWQ